MLHYYPLLAGSHGEVALELSNEFLAKLCAALKTQLKDSLKGLKDFGIVSSGHHRFRVRAKLASDLFNWLGAVFLGILDEEGVEIRVRRHWAEPGKPLQGKLSTNLMAKPIIPIIVQKINQALGVGEVLEMRSEFLSSDYEISLDPFPILRKYLPASMGQHIERVEVAPKHGAIHVKIHLRHPGP